MATATSATLIIVRVTISESSKAVKQMAVKSATALLRRISDMFRGRTSVAHLQLNNAVGKLLRGQRLSVRELMFKCVPESNGVDF